MDEPLIKARGITSTFNPARRAQLNKLPENERLAEKSLRNLAGAEDVLLTASERLGHQSPDTTKKFYRDKVTRCTAVLLGCNYP